MFERRLRAISERLDGAVAIGLVAGDGIPVTSICDRPEIDLETLAVEVLTQMRALADDHREFEIGEVHQLALTTDRFVVMAGAVAAGYYLLLVLDGAKRFGRARFELRRAPLAFAKDLR